MIKKERSDLRIQAGENATVVHAGNGATVNMMTPMSPVPVGFESKLEANDEVSILREEVRENRRTIDCLVEAQTRFMDSTAQIIAGLSQSASSALPQNQVVIHMAPGANMTLGRELSGSSFFDKAKQTIAARVDRSRSLMDLRQRLVRAL